MTAKKQPAVFIVPTQATVARFLGVARSSVSDWSRRPGFPGGRLGPYDLSEVARWMFCIGPWRSEAARSDYLEGLGERR